MKKIKASIITFMILALMLTGCGNDTKTTNASSESATLESASSESTTLESVASESTTPESVASESTTVTENSTSTTTLVANENGYKRGVWEGSSYKNETLGFTYELPKDWESMTMEELNALAGLTGEEIDFSNEDGLSYDMLVGDAEGNTMIQLMVTDLSILNSDPNKVTADTFSEIYKMQLKSDGTNYTFGNNTTTIAGEEYTVLTAENPTDSTTQWWMMRNNGKYMLTFVGMFNTADTEAFKTQLAEFKAI